MTLETPTKPLLVALAVVVALFLMTGAFVVSSSWTSGVAKVEQLVDRSGRAETGLTAIATICLEDLGPWSCFQRLEGWGERVIAAEVDSRRIRSGRTPLEFRGDLLGVFVKIVPAPRMLAACPLVRKQECAARMIDFGYGRFETMSLLSKD